MGAGVCLLTLVPSRGASERARRSPTSLVETEIGDEEGHLWPSMDDSRRGLRVVGSCVAVMVTFLAASDFGLQWFFFHVVYGQGRGWPPKLPRGAPK